MEIIKVFLLMFVLDIVWSKCIWSVSGDSPGRAAAWASAFYVISTLVVLDVVKQPWMMIPAAAGAWTGTYFIVWRRLHGTVGAR